MSKVNESYKIKDPLGKRVFVAIATAIFYPFLALFAFIYLCYEMADGLCKKLFGKGLLNEEYSDFDNE